MITRQRIVTVLTTTAIAYSICSPTQAAGLVGAARLQAREPATDDVDHSLQNAIQVAFGPTVRFTALMLQCLRTPVM
jgi:hyperosmotically inducible protein